MTHLKKNKKYYRKFTRHSRKRVFGYKINAPMQLLYTHANKLITSDAQICFTAPYLYHN